MGQLYDQIMDEAEELAANEVMLPDASDFAIVSAVSEIVGVNFDEHTIAGHIALAAYRRDKRMAEFLSA